MNPAPKKLVVFGVLVAAIALMPWFGPGPLLAAVILATAVLGVPLFVIIGIATVVCYVLWSDLGDVSQLRRLVERIRTLADNDTLLAVPLFMMSGAVMARGEISVRLIDFAKALVGWMPGGLAISAVLACMFFAAISGSSPATVVAIGGMMVPTLLKQGYSDRFSHGLLTSAGSMGILIPPSIPMVVFPIVFTASAIQVERLFAAGFGPGILIGAMLMGYSFYRGLKDNAARQQFSMRELGRATVDGFWSLMFPMVILGGISFGIFNAVEAAAISVVYAIVVEIWIHGALQLKQIPKISQETGVLLGSLLVIMVAALAFSEFLEDRQIPQMAVAWIRSLDLNLLTFLIILNVLLLVVGCFMDILSAMFIFVPLLGPIAISMGIHPIHFAIIFIVNLEIGYLSPPVGLNLFVASTCFNRPVEHIIRSVLPFIGVMILGLGLVTYVPSISVGFGDWLLGIDEAPAPTQPTSLDALDGLDEEDEPSLRDEAPGVGSGGVQTIEEMMRELEAGGSAGEDAASDEPTDEPPSDEPTDEPTDAERRNPNRVMTMEEMMEALEGE